MYRCELCNRVSRPGDRAVKVVLERRPAEYPSRGKAQRARTSRRSKPQDDPGDKPEAFFKIDGKNVSAREYCNLHGHWKSA